MKKLLVLLFIIWVTNCSAQNYQCLQAGVEHYFINGNGYLRGISIDSVETSGSDNIFYPFKTGRKKPSSPPYTVMDTVMGSWLGGKVIMNADGTFLFDNYWRDTIVIRSQATLGDNWVFYSDSTTKYYTATVTGTDTMTVLGVLDSVKTITIHAYLSGVLNPSDSINNLQLTLSKNNGFVKVFDLYTFPYRFPSGQTDYYYQKATTNLYGLFSFFSQSIPFKLIDFQNPNNVEIFNFNVGDTFEWETWTYILSACYDCTRYTGMQSDIILSKNTPDPYHVEYIIQHDAVETDYSPTSTVTHYEIHVIDTAIYDTSLLLPTLRTEMPEEYTKPYYYYFFVPDDDECVSSSLYGIAYPEHYGAPMREQIFKQEFGKKMSEYLTYFPFGSGYDPYSSSSIFNSMIFSSTSGISCGTYHTIPVSVTNVVKDKALDIFPNPTTDNLSVTSNATITSISIANIMGQEVYKCQYNTNNVQINISNLTAGVYVLKVNETEVRKFVKE